MYLTIGIQFTLLRHPQSDNQLKPSYQFGYLDDCFNILSVDLKGTAINLDKHLLRLLANYQGVVVGNTKLTETLYPNDKCKDLNMAIIMLLYAIKYIYLNGFDGIRLTVFGRLTYILSNICI